MCTKVKISAVIITFNEEKKIERCLKSLNWVDEIIIVDSFSTDRTLAICSHYTTKIYQHPWPNSSSEQRKIADNYTTNDWVLALDADEVVTKGLRDEIISNLTNANNVDLFRIPRLEYFSGKWIKAGGWYPQYKNILYRKSRGKWIGPIHLKFVTEGGMATLKNPILHDGYTDFKVFMDKFNNYSSIEADMDYKKHHKRFSITRALLKPIERFFGRFMLHKGYKDGLHGFYLAAVIAINYFLREFKIYENNFSEHYREDWDMTYRELAVYADIEKNSHSLKQT